MEIELITGEKLDIVDSMYGNYNDFTHQQWGDTLYWMWDFMSKTRVTDFYTPFINDDWYFENPKRYLRKGQQFFYVLEKQGNDYKVASKAVSEIDNYYENNGLV